jgi:hypothetical protein
MKPARHLLTGFLFVALIATNARAQPCPISDSQSGLTHLASPTLHGDNRIECAVTNLGSVAHWTRVRVFSLDGAVLFEACALTEGWKTMNLHTVFPATAFCKFEIQPAPSGGAPIVRGRICGFDTQGESPNVCLPAN